MPSRGAPSRRLLRRELSLVPRRKAAFKRQHPQLPLRERREQLPSALPQRWGSWLVPVLIALVTFAAFLPTLQNQFVSGLFYLSAILMYLRACERGARGRGWYWAAVGL